ncbi:sortase-dependent protein [Streptomyces sp. NPDC060006]|uniref:sortase-dependent protein n=1 Tax=unclassified Streptomyces TaxID=2593676 RepID=UPI003644606F
MRRTVLSALALACTAVLAGAVPAFADGTSPTPATTAAPSAAPSTEPTKAPTPEASLPASAEPTRAPSGSEVSVVPSGAPDTGEAASESGSATGLIGGGAAAVLVGGGAAVYLVRRRQANEA